MLWKGVLKICRKFTREHPCRSAISVKLQSNFIEMAPWHECSPVYMLHILRAPFPKNMLLAGFFWRNVTKPGIWFSTEIWFRLSLNFSVFYGVWYGTKYWRLVQVKFEEESLEVIQGYLPQTLFGPFLNTLSRIMYQLWINVH